MEQITITPKKQKIKTKKQKNTINNNTQMKFVLLKKNSFINLFIIKILFISY